MVLDELAIETTPILRCVDSAKTGWEELVGRSPNDLAAVFHAEARYERQIGMRI
jgi:hypothetical protein